MDYAIELLGPFGTVSSRPMFGGHGVYLDGLMFAIVHGDALWLKADQINQREFEAAGCERFSYVRKGEKAVFSFFRAPSEAMESSAAMIPWARSAYAAALRARGERPDRPVELALAPFAPPPRRSKPTSGKPPAAKRATKRPARKITVKRTAKARSTAGKAARGD